MKDIDGNEVEVGDIIKVINIDRKELESYLAEDEIQYHLDMVNNNFEVDEIVWDGEGASVSFQIEEKPGHYFFGGLYLNPNQCRLVCKKQINAKKKNKKIK